MSAQVVWLVTIIVLHPMHAERHPTVQFPTLDSCWRSGAEVVADEARCGIIAGFVCKPEAV